MYVVNVFYYKEHSLIYYVANEFINEDLPELTQPTNPILNILINLLFNY